MGKEGKRLKRCSTSTDVESPDGEGTKPLQKAEGELQNSETDVNPKKRKKKSKSKQTVEDDLEPKKTSDQEKQTVEDDLEPKKTSDQEKEMKKLRKSFKEMTETMKNLQDFLMGNADLLPGISMKEMLLTKSPDTSSKEEEEPVEKMDQLATHECCYETEDSDMNNDYTILVRGLDTSLTRDETKSALTKHFESWGCQVLRVFVPIECLTGARLGIAFVDVDDEERGLKLSYKGGWNLYLTLAKYSPEYHRLPNFEGCQHCGSFLLERRLKRFLDRPPRRY